MAAELLTDASRALDANSNPLPGAQWYFYATGTLTPQNVFSNASLATSLGAVVTADAGGRFVPIYFNSTLEYRGILKDAAGNTLPGMDIDPINTGALALADKVNRAETASFALVVDDTNPEAYGFRVDSVADGKQVDGIFVSSSMQNSGSGYPVHGIMVADASIAADAAGGGGFAADGVGNASGAVGNRQGAGPGNGLQGARLGSGVGAGVEARASSTGECYAVRGIKQNPSAGTAGTGPAVFAINDSTNGQALYARSASANTDSNTAVVERLNGTGGTGLFTQITGAGPRVGILIGGSTQVVPGALSTGASTVYGYDIQVSANISGATDTRGLNVAVNAIGAGESYGATIVVDGARTTSYGLFVNVANAGTNYGVYVAAGLSYFGGDANAATQYQVAGTKVLGAQGAAVADATDAASVITQLNALLARLRSHGLIAT